MPDALSVTPIASSSPPNSGAKVLPLQPTKPLDMELRPAPAADQKEEQRLKELAANKAAKLATDVFRDWLASKQKQHQAEQSGQLTTIPANSSPASSAPMSTAPNQSPTMPDANGVVNNFWMDP